jgi:hypothetical protein
VAVCQSPASNYELKDMIGLSLSKLGSVVVVWGEDLEASQSGSTPTLMLTLTLKIVPPRI